MDSDEIYSQGENIDVKSEYIEMDDSIIEACEFFDVSKMVKLELDETQDKEKRRNRSAEKEHARSGRPTMNKHKKRRRTKGCYACFHCDKTFGEKCNLEHHVRIHTGEKPYKCDRCERCFTQLGHLQGHIRSHTGERPHKCCLCGKGFSTPRILRSHMNDHSENSLHNPSNEFFKCQFCSFVAKSKRGLSFHSIVHRTNNSSTIDANLRTSPPKESTSTFKRSDRPFKCSYCSEVFTDKFVRNQHEDTHEGASKCMVCNKPFKSIDALIKHTRNSHKELTFIDGDRCIICNELFNCKNELIAHVSSHDELNPFECTVCGKRFKNSGVLNRHVIIHSDNKPFTCEICNKSFNTNTNMIRHKATHNSAETHAIATEQGLYCCSSCPSQFSTLSSLIQHKRSHGNDTPSTYGCSICKNVFTKASSLRDHLKQHHNEVQLHKCFECDKLYTRMSHLKYHMRIHSGEKPFTCPICSQSFRFRGGFSQHLKKHRAIADGEVIIPDKNVGDDKEFFDYSKSHNQMQNSQEIIRVENSKTVIVDNSENSLSSHCSYIENVKPNLELDSIN
ncbi:hypothetical protein LSTR_LSTR008097 [Laodelphax striatellus]|uniref:C2H2-type domain-containing protein n=1 Tax=Laodelphax striatellus TaxID=195883 RepID=A0A482XCL6_LAOST|nr:hypothetical protein LSTR_LSTR008097 [Laodelphax striatellus]